MVYLGWFMDHGLNQTTLASIWNMQSEENCYVNSVDILHQGTATHISLDKYSEVGINYMICSESERKHIPIKNKIYVSHLPSKSFLEQI